MKERAKATLTDAYEELEALQIIESQLEEESDQGTFILSDWIGQKHDTQTPIFSCAPGAVNYQLPIQPLPDNVILFSSGDGAAQKVEFKD